MRILGMFLLNIVLTGYLFGQDATHYSYEGEDLSSNIVYYMYEKDGRIYVATDNGLTIIGNDNNKILRNDSARSNSLTLIQEDNTGQLFVMNFRSQIFQIEDHGLELYFDLNDHFETRVKSYFFLGGYLYVNSSKDIKRFALKDLKEDVEFYNRYNSFTTYTEAKKYGDSVVIGSVVVNKDTLYRSEKLKTFFNSSVPKGETYLTPILSNESILYFTSVGRLIDYSEGLEMQYTNDNAITEINYFGSFNDLLWTTTNSGVFLVGKDSSSNCYHWLKGIPCSYVLQDYQNNLWVGTIGEGIKVFPEKDSEQHKIKGDYIFTSFLKNNDLYFGTKGGKVWINDCLKWHLDRVIDIFSVANDIYIQTLDSLYCYSDDKLLVQKSAGYYNSDYTHDNVTFLSSSSALLRIDSLSNKYHSKKLKNIGDYLQKDVYYQKILYNNNDSSFYGLNINDESISSLTDNENIFDSEDKQFKDIFYDHHYLDKEIYVVYNQSEIGKFNFDEQIIDHFYRFKYLIPKKCAIYDDVLVGYENGIIEIFNSKTGKSFIYDKMVFQYYEELVDIHLSDKFLFAVFSDGVHKIPLSVLLAETSKVFLNPPKIDGPKQFNPVFDQCERVIIHLNFFDELNKSHSKIRYRLNDNQWVELEMVDQISFEQLGYGSYSLKIEYIKHGEVIGRHKITFRVRPYWYQTNWFLLFIILFVSFAFLLFYRIRIKYIRERLNQKNKLVQAQLSAINAQMKPHFVFNSLNSIQNTILQEDRFIAAKRLSEFSGFVRKTLDFSRQESITLREELEMIETYIKFEGYRFKDKFSFQLKTTLQDSTLETAIPPFIIQPYIENSIVHGVSHLKKGGVVILEMSQNLDTITCKVIDNGIGLEESKKKNLRRSKHKSFATEANFNRIELLKNGAVEINSTSNGTTVIITFTA